MVSMGTDGLEGEYPRPDAFRVLRRAQALAAVVCRSFTENQDDQAYARELHARVSRWIERLSLQYELEPDELAMISAPLGTLDRKQIINGGWRSEGLAVLAWVMAKHPLPRHDELVVPVEVAEAVGFLHDPDLSNALLTGLRANSEIDEMEQHLLALHWRFRDFHLHRRAMDFATFVRDCSWAALKVDPEVLVEGDIGIARIRIDQADLSRVQECGSIAQERHQAINWLMGSHPAYSQVGTDT